jgi:hypothetical protein
LKNEIRVGQVIDGKKVVRIIPWKVHYDTKEKIPCGQRLPEGATLFVCDPSDKLPNIVNKPHWVEDREAMMIIFAKRGVKRK